MSTEITWTEWCLACANMDNIITLVLHVCILAAAVSFNLNLFDKKKQYILLLINMSWLHMKSDVVVEHKMYEML